MSSMSAAVPLKNPDKWGSVQEVVNETPLLNVTGVDSWICVLGFYLLLPITLLSVLPVLMCAPCTSAVLIETGIGLCACTAFFSQLGNVRTNGCFAMAFFSWRNVLAVLLVFVKEKLTRLRLFYAEKTAFGDGSYWFHGEGVWTGDHGVCDQILRGVQLRKTAFACVQAPAPDLFPSNILVFLPNTGSDSEWAAIRFAMHQHLFANIEDRMKQIPSRIAAAWPKPKLSDTDDKDFLKVMVSQSVFFCLFGVWLDKEDALTLSMWDKAAKYCIFPRMVHRWAFNALLNVVKNQRVATIGLIEKHNLQGVFEAMNDSLPEKYKRPSIAKLADEVLFVLCFAGVNGTLASLVSTCAFMQNKHPDESWAEKTDLSRYPTPQLMAQVWKKDPYNYIKEACRLDPPVTSATTSFAQDMDVPMGGRDVHVTAGSLQQYTISIANRDEAVFADPELFNPDRPDLNFALTWNGSFSTKAASRFDEQSYPRLCPGRFFAMDVVMHIVNHAISEM